MKPIILFLLTVCYFFRNKAKELIAAPILHVVKAIQKFCDYNDWNERLQSFIWITISCLLALMLAIGLGFLVTETNFIPVLIVFGCIVGPLILFSITAALIHQWTHYWKDPFIEWVHKNKGEVALLGVWVGLTILLPILGAFVYHRPYQVEKTRVDISVTGFNYLTAYTITNKFEGENSPLMDVVHFNRNKKVFAVLRYHSASKNMPVETNGPNDVCISTTIFTYRHITGSDIEFMRRIPPDMSVLDGLKIATNLGAKYYETTTPETHRVRNAVIGGFIPTALFLLLVFLAQAIPPFVNFIASNWKTARKQAEYKMNLTKRKPR